MKHYTPDFKRRNVRAAFAGLLTYMLLVGQVAPLALAANRSPVRASAATQKADIAREGVAPALEAAAAPAPLAPAAFVPSVTATKTDSFPDPNNTGHALPGDIISYTVAITNAVGADPATGVSFVDNVDNNTTLIPGSVNASPLAFDDVYNTIGNTLLEVGVAAGPNPAVRVTTPANDSVFDNDTEFLGDTFTLQSFQAASALGGTVSMNAAGNFTYLPPVGVTGVTDTFTYTIVDAGADNIPANADDLTSTGTVSVSIANRVWYVNSAAGVNGDGRSSTPFNALLPTTVSGVGGAGDADSAGDIIYLFSSATAYTGGIPLENTQALIGGGVALVVNTITLQAAGATPTVTNAAGNGVTLASGNAIAGFNVGNSTLSAIAGTSFGTATINNVAINTNGQALSLGTGTVAGAGFSSTTSTGGVNNVSLTTVDGTVNLGSGALSGATSHGLSISGGASSVNFSGTITNSAARSVSVASKTGGTVALSGAVSGTGQGVFLNANTGAVINFTGGLSLSTGANAAFTATGGGTVSATQNNAAIVNTLTTTTGTALNVANTTIGASGLTFRSISANGATNGIVLNATGTSGGLTVTGNSSGLCGGQVTGVPAVVTAPNAADCTGGVIQSTTGAGILLTSTSNVSLTRIRVANALNDGVFGTSVTGFTLASSLIENNGNAVEEAGLDFDNLHGTSSITNSVIRLAHENNVEVRNNTNNGSQATLSITGSTINNATAKTQSDDGVLYEGLGTANVSLTVSGCALFANRGDHLQATGNNTSDTAVVFLNNTLTGGHGTALGQDIVVNTGTTASGATFTYDINGNRINGAILSAITATLGTPSVGVTMQGRIRNNLIGTTGVSESGSIQANGVAINQTGGGTHTVAITGNTIRQWESRGISASAFDASGNLNITIQSNTILEGNAVDPISMVGGREAVLVIAGSSAAGDTNTVCAQIGGAGALSNNVNRGPEAVISGEQDIRVRARSSATFRIPGYGGGAADTTAVQNFLAPLNTSSVDGVVGVEADKAATSPGFVGGASCATPSFVSGVEGDPLPPSDDGASIATTEGGEMPNTGPAALEQPATEEPVAAEGAPELGRPSRADASRTSSGWRAPASTAAAAPAALGAGGTVNVSIGTLNAGKTVTIVFAVTVDAIFTGSSPKQVSNQGTVNYGPGGLSTQTDDPSPPPGLPTAGNNPTITPINFPDIFIRDAKVAEPASGSDNMIFTVALSTPALSPVSVNFTTNPDTGGANPATVGADYTSDSGTITFSATEQVKTISVPVLAEGANPDSVENVEETFLVDLSLPVGGRIIDSLVDGQAVGTITGPQAPGTVQITELRTSGPGGSQDDFVEVYNNSDTPLNTGATGWALVASNNGCSGSPVLVGLIPPSTTIPARGHYLFTGLAAQYSLANYGGAGLGAGDQTLLADLGNDVNVGLFETDALLNISSMNLRDAVGFGLNLADTCDLLREGATLPTASGSITQHSFVRKVTLVSADVPTPTDTHNNASDFYPISTTPLVPISASIATPVLGQPGPENRTGPTIKKFSQVGAHQLDPTLLSSAVPNRVRKTCAQAAEECLPNRSAQGTISMRRRFANNTGGPITRLRFRVYLTNTYQGPSVPVGTADLRGITSSATTATVTGIPGTVTVNGTTAEMYATQAPTDMGGGWNSTFAVPGTVISTGTPLLDGASVNVQFLFGVQQGGSFSILVHVEALP